VNNTFAPLLPSFLALSGLSSDIRTIDLPSNLDRKKLPAFYGSGPSLPPEVGRVATGERRASEVNLLAHFLNLIHAIYYIYLTFTLSVVEERKFYTLERSGLKEVDDRVTFTFFPSNHLSFSAAPSFPPPCSRLECVSWMHLPLVRSRLPTTTSLSPRIRTLRAMSYPSHLRPSAQPSPSPSPSSSTHSFSRYSSSITSGLSKGLASLAGTASSVAGNVGALTGATGREEVVGDDPESKSGGKTREGRYGVRAAVGGWLGSKGIRRRQ